MHKKLSFNTTIALTLVSLLISPFSLLHFPFSLAHASSPSPSPTDNGSTVNANLKKRLQESLSTPDNPQTSNNKGYIGKIKDIIKDTVIMEDKDGEKDFKLTSNTTIIRSPGTSTIKPEDMRLGDYIIAIGTPKDADVLEAKRLIVSIDPIQNTAKTSGYGTISKLSKNSLSLTIDGSDKLATINTKTIFKSSVATIDYTDLSVGDTVIFTATADEKDLLTISVIMRVKTASLGQ